MILWIAYQPASGDADARDSMHGAIRVAAGAPNVFRAVEDGWLVDTDETPSKWMDKFDDMLKPKDKILITRLRRGAAAVNMTGATDWLKEHRESFE